MVKAVLVGFVCTLTYFQKPWTKYSTVQRFLTQQEFTHAHTLLAGILNFAHARHFYAKQPENLCSFEVGCPWLLEIGSGLEYRGFQVGCHKKKAIESSFWWEI